MAIVHCQDCQAAISDRAWKCPHCGAPNQSRRRDVLRKIALIPLWGIVIAVALIMLALAFQGLTYSSRSERQQRLANQERADQEWQRLKAMIEKQNADKAAIDRLLKQ